MEIDVSFLAGHIGQAISIAIADATRPRWVQVQGGGWVDVSQVEYAYVDNSHSDYNVTLWLKSGSRIVVTADEQWVRKHILQESTPNAQ